MTATPGFGQRLCRHHAALQRDGHRQRRRHLELQLREHGQPRRQHLLDHGRLHPDEPLVDQPRLHLLGLNLGAQSLTVTQQGDTTGTSLNTITSSVTFNNEDQTFSGTVTGTAGDGNPQGSVSVFAGTTLLCSATVTGNGDGTSSYSCASTVNLDANTYSITAVFTPTSPSSTNPDYTYSGSTSGAQSLTVTQQGDTTGTSLNTITSSVTFNNEFDLQRHGHRHRR